MTIRNLFLSAIIVCVVGVIGSRFVGTPNSEQKMIEQNIQRVYEKDLSMPFVKESDVIFYSYDGDDFSTEQHTVPKYGQNERVQNEVRITPEVSYKEPALNSNQLIVRNDLPERVEHQVDISQIESGSEAIEPILVEDNQLNNELSLEMNETDSISQSQPSTEQSETSVEKLEPTDEILTGEQFLEAVEQEIFELVNEQREASNLFIYRYDDTMQNYARLKSKDMGDKGYFDHRDMSGNLITEQMKADGVTYQAWAENIAYITATTNATEMAKQLMDNWMESSGHRANILSNNYDSIGVGVYQIGDRVYATQQFYR